MLSRFSHVRLFATLWTAACHAPLPMGFSRQEYWSGLPFPLPGDLPNPRIELISQYPDLAGGFFTTSPTWEAPELFISWTSTTYPFPPRSRSNIYTYITCTRMFLAAVFVVAIKATNNIYSFQIENYLKVHHQ